MYIYIRPIEYVIAPPHPTPPHLFNAYQLDALSLPRFRLLNAWAVHMVTVDTHSTIQHGAVHVPNV